jgi:hypothetical protein
LALSEKTRASVNAAMAGGIGSVLNVRTGRHERIHPATALHQTGRVARPVSAKDRTGWRRWLPGLRVLRHYEPAWLPHDLMAGLALTAVLVPVGVAHAEASGVSGVCGRYATLAGLLA